MTTAGVWLAILAVVSLELGFTAKLKQSRYSLRVQYRGCAVSYRETLESSWDGLLGG